MDEKAKAAFLELVEKLQELATELNHLESSLKTLEDKLARQPTAPTIIKLSDFN